MNVILTEPSEKGSYCAKDIFHSRVSVYSLNICLCNALGKWCQPSVWFPFRRIGPPYRWVTVHIINMDEHIRVFRYEDLMGLATVDIVNGRRKWKHDITLCAADL
jgi:hypothetical protein